MAVVEKERERGGKRVLWAGKQKLSHSWRMPCHLKFIFRFLSFKHSFWGYFQFQSFQVLNLEISLMQLKEVSQHHISKQEANPVSFAEDKGCCC